MPLFWDPTCWDPDRRWDTLRKPKGLAMETFWCLPLHIMVWRFSLAAGFFWPSAEKLLIDPTILPTRSSALSKRNPVTPHYTLGLIILHRQRAVFSISAHSPSGGIFVSRPSFILANCVALVYGWLHLPRAHNHHGSCPECSTDSQRAPSQASAA